MLLYCIRLYIIVSYWCRERRLEPSMPSSFLESLWHTTEQYSYYSNWHTLLFLL